MSNEFLPPAFHQRKYNGAYTNDQVDGYNDALETTKAAKMLDAVQVYVQASEAHRWARGTLDNEEYLASTQQEVETTWKRKEAARQRMIELLREIEEETPKHDLPFMGDPQGFWP